MSKSEKDRPRLGRGLNSLISVNAFATGETSELERPTVLLEKPVVPPPSDRLLDLPTDLIDPNPHQPRRDFSEAALGELAASMKSSGVIQPIAVRKNGERYELIAGERRLRAAKLAGLATIPAILRRVDGVMQAQLALVENIQRENLNPIDRANAYAHLIHELGISQADLAVHVGEERSTIANYLRLLELPIDVRNHLQSGRLSFGHAKVLPALRDPRMMVLLANRAVDEGLSVKALAVLVAKKADLEVAGENPAPAVSPSAQPGAAHFQEVERNVAAQLGMRVNLRHGHKKGNGRLVIHYGSLDQFDELMNRLGVKIEE